MIHDIFPTKIYKVHFPYVNELRKNIEPLLGEVFEKTKDDNQGSMRQQGLCSYNAVRDLHNIVETKLLCEFIEFHMTEYWKQLRYKKNIVPKIIEMWANKYPKGSFIDWHNHSPITITSSLYLQIGKDGGNLVFEHPNELILKYQPIISEEEKNIYHNLFTEEINVETGDLIMFPGYLRHRTLPNLNDIERIIIGTNISY